MILFKIRKKPFVDALRRQLQGLFSQKRCSLSLKKLLARRERARD